ncbi:MAG TPA: hypothetical protein VI298_01715 [Geobacteraceae bacterium]
MHGLLPLMGLIIFGFAINVPLGYLRQNYRKFSFGWYFYVHISIPLIIYLRIKAGFSWMIIPLTISAAVAGQLVGGRLRKRSQHSG